jgi:hypothetical protein
VRRFAGKLALLTLLAAFPCHADQTQEILPPIPRGQWIILLPPTVYSRELKRLVIDDLAPRAQWKMDVGTEKMGSRALCEEYLAFAKGHVLRIWEDNPSQAIALVARQYQRAECAEGDGKTAYAIFGE